MSKRQQLEQMEQLGLPVPAFRAVSYEAWQSGSWDSQGLKPPFIVRSSYATEDGAEQSMAGQFKSVLPVQRAGLEEALATVFRSYPTAAGSEAVVQELVEPDYSGVLFAFREGCWKVELAEGQGEALMSGRADAKSIILPHFSTMDYRLYPMWRFWGAWPEAPRPLSRALVRLSAFTSRLLYEMKAPHGLDIEFCIKHGRLWLLQARPITTADEAEEVLTSANHKEILPPRPSVLMTEMISTAGYALYGYYRSLDSSLPERAFLKTAAGMPWINLSALLDTMVHWGLPTQLVCRSVGAEDFYRVGLRPWQALRKLPVFFKVLGQQLGAKRRIERWQAKASGDIQSGIKHRSSAWAEQPADAFAHWREDFRQLYVELVTHMQILTGAMSGPVSLLDQFGLLPKLSAALSKQSASTDYLNAFREWQAGGINRAEFLERFGHRGFYESDIGQPRFFEYTEEDWQRLERPGGEAPLRPSNHKAGLLAIFFAPIVQLIHSREWIRDETMKLFWSLRQELLEQLPISPWELPPSRVQDFLRGKLTASEAQAPGKPEQSGWDMDTFLANQMGRRLPLSHLANVQQQAQTKTGIGIYPGKVRGQVWRVKSAGFDELNLPVQRPCILVADALDPGWVPFFSQVDGVVAYVGGVLSHASIILRESKIPAVTQLPAQVALKTGDWVEMDGQTGRVDKVENNT